MHLDTYELSYVTSKRLLGSLCGSVKNEMEVSVFDNEIARLVGVFSEKENPEQALFLRFSAMDGQDDNLSTIRQHAAEMVWLLGRTINPFLADVIVLRLSELISHDPREAKVVGSLLTSESELGLAGFCHIAGHCNENGLVFGDHVKKLATHTSAMVRRRAMQALRRLARQGLADTENILREGTDDSDPDVREEAVQGLR